MARTVQDVLDIIFATIPGAPREGTLDTLKSGDPKQIVTGIVSTFTATRDVLARTVELGANFVITHEGTYYSHSDEVDWLEGDRVYESKRKFLADHGLAVWRFHEYWHGNRGGRPDGILTGLERKLDWENLADPPESGVYRLPPTTLADLAEHVKTRLGFCSLRAAGDPAMRCSRVRVMMGWMCPVEPPIPQIRALAPDDIDVLICGETHEWETCEYVRDSVAAGSPKGLLVIGHRNSEEAGMEYLVEWLQPRVPDIPVTYVPAGDPFRTL
jgi:putative NIF3 family GTP cyclohydrolase 1 type 2